MRGALDVHRALLAADVPHEVVRLDSRITEADELPRALGLRAGCLAVRCYLVSRERTERRERRAADSFAAVLVPAGAIPDPASLLTALSACSVRPASPGEVNDATEYAAGLVSPVALPPEVELLADTAVGACDVVYTAVGEGGLALGIRTRDLLVFSGARVATLTSSALAAPALETGRPDVIDLDLATVRRFLTQP